MKNTLPPLPSSLPPLTPTVPPLISKKALPPLKSSPKTASPSSLPPLKSSPKASPKKTLPPLKSSPKTSPKKTLPPLKASLPPLKASPKASPKKTLPLLKSSLPLTSLPPLKASPKKTLPPLKSSLLPLKTSLPHISSPEKLGRTLSSLKDVDLKILMELNDRDLLSFCSVDKYANNLCRNEDFWRNRFIKKFGIKSAKYKPVDRNWRNHYLKVIVHLDEFSKPWTFFDGLSWMIGEGEKITYDGKSIRENPESIRNAYWLLDLGNEITFEFPIDRYDEMDHMRRTFKTDTYFTPAKVVELIEKFYDESLTRKELEEMQEAGVDAAEEWDLKNADIGMVSRGDILGTVFFEGFFRNDDGALTMRYGS